MWHRLRRGVAIERGLGEERVRLGARLLRLWVAGVVLVVLAEAALLKVR